MSGSAQGVDFGGGVAVITGAASGLGEALARHAAQQYQMKLVLADIDEAGLQRVSQELAAQGCETLALKTDVTDAAAMEQLALATQQRFGTPRLLVNNAGIETIGWSWEIPAHQWDKILDVNIHGVVHGVRAFLPAMLEQGEACVIANLSSLAGVATAPLQTSYIMSKHAVLAFSECLHMELQMKQAPVQVSAILPGPVKTNIFASLDEVDDPDVAHHLQEMVQLLDANGMGSEEAASIIFSQLAAGQFWVSTHPEMVKQMARQRAEQLSSLQAPVMPAQSEFNVD